jgi:hypothetical protein
VFHSIGTASYLTLPAAFVPVRATVTPARNKHLGGSVCTVLFSRLWLLRLGILPQVYAVPCVPGQLLRSFVNARAKPSNGSANNTTINNSLPLLSRSCTLASSRRKHEHRSEEASWPEGNQ